MVRAPGDLNFLSCPKVEKSMFSLVDMACMGGVPVNKFIFYKIFRITKNRTITEPDCHWHVRLYD